MLDLPDLSRGEIEIVWGARGDKLWYFPAAHGK